MTQFQNIIVFCKLNYVNIILPMNEIKALGLIHLIIMLSSISLPSQSNDLQGYNKLKYMAESEIIAENYCQATEIYSIMKDSFFLWFNDLNNALLSGLLCDDESFIGDMTSLFLKGGYSPLKLEKTYYEFDYFSSEAWFEIKDAPIETAYNTEIRTSMEVMYHRDQEDRYNEPLRLRNDMENMIELSRIMDIYGFPSEKELGYTDASDSLDYNQMFELVLIHLSRLFRWQMSEMLTEKYFERSLTKADYVYLMGFTGSCDDKQLTCFPGPPASNALYVDGVIFSCSDEDMKRINTNRSAHYLDSVAEQIQKIKFRKSSSLTWYLDDGFATWNYNKEKDDFESIKAKLETEGLKVYQEK